MGGSVRLTGGIEHCPGCNAEFSSVARHWASVPDHRPSLDYLQRCVCAGLVLGRGKVETQNETPAIDVRTRDLRSAKGKSSDSRIITSLRQAARDLGRFPTTTEYREWNLGNSIRQPSYYQAQNRFGGWAGARRAALSEIGDLP